MSILHFPKLKLYVYASTDEILYRALVDSPLFGALRRWEYEEIEIQEGDILKILYKGKLERDCFDFSYSYRGRDWWDYGCYGYEEENEYLRDLISVAAYLGYSDQDIKHLRNCGYSYAEIEEALYEMTVEV